MSVEQMALVWQHQFDHAEQAIMLALADHAHDDGTEIRPSVARLAWKTGYEERQIYRILKRLRDEIKILVLVAQGGGRGKPNVYRFDWTKGVKKSPFKPQTKTLTSETKRVTSEDVNPDISEINPDTAMSEEPSVIEPSSLLNAPKGALETEPPAPPEEPEEEEENEFQGWEIEAEIRRILQANGTPFHSQELRRYTRWANALRKQGVDEETLFMAAKRVAGEWPRIRLVLSEAVSDVESGTEEGPRVASGSSPKRTKSDLEKWKEAKDEEAKVEAKREYDARYPTYGTRSDGSWGRKDT